MKVDPRANPMADEEKKTMIFDLITEAKNVGRVVRGVNEATKYVNRSKARLVVVAADAIPLEIVLHLPDLCEDKGIQCIFVQSRQELGKLLGLSRPVISVAITAGKKTSLDDKIDHVLHRLE